MSSQTISRMTRDTETDDDRDDADAPVAVCPFCESEDTELESTFGSEVSKSQYYCRECRTIFERIKFDGTTPSTGREYDGSR